MLERTISVIALSNRDFPSFEAKVREAIEWIKIAAGRKSDLAVLPEFLNIYKGDGLGNPEAMNLKDAALENWEKETVLLRETALRHHIALAVPLLVREKGILRNAMFLISKEGETLGRYDKTYPTTGELNEGVAWGEGAALIEWEGIKVAGAICFDTNFHDVFEESARAGAQLFVVPSLWPGGDWLNYFASRYSVPVALAYPAWSRIIDIDGRELTEGGYRNETLRFGVGIPVYTSTLNFDRMRVFASLAQKTLIELETKYAGKIVTRFDQKKLCLYHRVALAGYKCAGSGEGIRFLPTSRLSLELPGGLATTKEARRRRSMTRITKLSISTGRRESSIRMRRNWRDIRHIRPAAADKERMTARMITLMRAKPMGPSRRRFHAQIGILICYSMVMPIFTFGVETDQQTPPITKGQRVFTVGHSFHTWVVPILDEIAKSAGISDHHVAGVSYIGGSTVLQHWNLPDAQNKAKQALISGQVDVLTLAPIWLPDAGIENFVTLGLQHNPDLRITVQEYWLPNDTYHPVYPLETTRVVDHNAATMPELRKQHKLYFNDMDNYVRDLNKKLGKKAVFVVPVGQAVLALREKIIAGRVPGLKTQAELFYDSWGHPEQVIEVLAAYCHFAVIYRRSPVGLPVPRLLTEDQSWPDFTQAVDGLRVAPFAPAVSIEKIQIPTEDIAPLNRLLQQLAWDAVIHHPMSGVSAQVVGP